MKNNVTDRRLTVQRRRKCIPAGFAAAPAAETLHWLIACWSKPYFLPHNAPLLIKSNNSTDAKSGLARRLFDD